MVGVVPDVTTEHAGVRHGSNIDCDGRHCLLLRIVPVDAGRVGNRRAFQERRLNDRLEAQRHRFGGIERAVIGEVIGRDDLACDADPGG